MSRGLPDKDADLVRAYEKLMGHPPRNLPEDHPDVWQWLYRGSKADKEKLREWLGWLDDDEDEPVVIEGQEELF